MQHPLPTPTLFSLTHQVQFSETDMAGIVHFSNFFKWMEMTETQFLSHINVPFAEFSPSDAKGWPKGSASCSYKSPLRFQDSVQISLSIKELRNHSIVYTFLFTKINPDATTSLAASGEMTTIYAIFDPAHPQPIRAALIPDHFRTKLSTTP